MRQLLPAFLVLLAACSDPKPPERVTLELQVGKVADTTWQRVDSAATRAEVKSYLRNLATGLEEYRSRTGRWTTDVSALGVAAIDSVTAAIVMDGDDYVITAKHGRGFSCHYTTKPGATTCP